MDWLVALHDAVVKGRLRDISLLADRAVSEGVAAHVLVNEALVPAMRRVGELWRNEEFFLPEVLRAAKTMQAAMDALTPHLVHGTHGKRTTVAIGTVKGDLHDVGKNLVAIIVKSAGYRVENLGVDVAPERFVEAAGRGAQVIGLSSMLTTTMGQMEDVIELFATSGMRDKVMILIGGAPITREFAARIGADQYAKDALEAVRILDGRFG